MIKVNRSPDAAAGATAPAEEIETLSIRGVPVKAKFYEQVRGKTSKTRCRPVYDMAAADPFAEHKKIFGIENYNRLVAETINDAWDEAADECRNAEGKIDAKAMGEKIPEQATRGKRTKVGELRKQFEEKSREMAPVFDKVRSGTATQEETVKFNRLYAEWKEISAKLDKKHPGGTVKK